MFENLLSKAPAEEAGVARSGEGGRGEAEAADAVGTRRVLVSQGLLTLNIVCFSCWRRPRLRI